MASPPERFLIWGAGGHGSVVADLLRALGHHVVGYADERSGVGGPYSAADAPEVLMGEAELFDHIRETGSFPREVDALALGIGDNRVRLARARGLAGLALPALVHPTAALSGSAQVGDGSTVMALAVINARAVVGRAAIVNSGAIVEHDCDLADGVHVSPGAVLAGGVTVGERAWIGVGATIIPGVRIGASAVVGAGAVVIQDVADSTTVVGNPARVLPSVGAGS